MHIGDCKTDFQKNYGSQKKRHPEKLWKAEKKSSQKILELETIGNV